MEDRSVLPDPSPVSGHADRASPEAPLAPEGIYLHVPFCLSLCPYCDFVVVAGAAARSRDRVAALVEAELEEIDLRADLSPGVIASDRRPLASVYLGGGTPSLLSAAQVGQLLERIDRRFGIAAGAEITLEANPGPEDLGDLPGMRAAGVDRLSIGAQSLDDGELRRLGRRHGVGDVRAAVDAARAAGFTSVNLDLLTDIPGQTMASWRATLTAALGLEPEHLSVYTLALADPEAEGLTDGEDDHLPVSAGARAWRARARLAQSEEQAAEMELLIDELAEAAGLQRYEIANLARPGFECRHNLLYWRRRPHLAIGPGAHAFDGRRRRSWNGARLDAYLSALAVGRLPPSAHEDIDAATAVAEEAILGLRLVEGIGPELASRPLVAPALAWARGQGLAEDVEQGGRVRLSRAGRLLANEVFERLLPGPGPAGLAPGEGTAGRASAPDAASA